MECKIKSWTISNRCFLRGYIEFNQENIKTEVLNMYNPTIHLNENNTPSYFESRKLIFYLLHLEVAKLKKNVKSR